MGKQEWHEDDRFPDLTEYMAMTEEELEELTKRREEERKKAKADK